MNRFLKNIAFCVFFIASTYAQSQIIFVDSKLSASGDGATWETAYNTLAEAISKSQAGNEIWLAEGDYVNASNDTMSLGYYVNHSLAIKGGFNGELNERDRVEGVKSNLYVDSTKTTVNSIFFINASDLVFELEAIGFHDLNYQVWNYTASQTGNEFKISNTEFENCNIGSGSIVNFNGDNFAKLVCDNIVVTNGTSYFYGYNDMEFVFLNSTFTSNLDQIFSFYGSRLSIDNCHFRSNQDEIINISGIDELELKNSDFIDNKASSLVIASSTTSITIEACFFYKNELQYQIFNFHGGIKTIELNNSRIEKNVSSNTLIRLQGDVVNFTGDTLIDNISEYQIFESSYSAKSLSIQNSLFLRNNSNQNSFFNITGKDYLEFLNVQLLDNNLNSSGDVLLFQFNGNKDVQFQNIHLENYYGKVLQNTGSEETNFFNSKLINCKSKTGLFTVWGNVSFNNSSIRECESQQTFITTYGKLSFIESDLKDNISYSSNFIETYSLLTIKKSRLINNSILSGNNDRLISGYGSLNLENSQILYTRTLSGNFTFISVGYQGSGFNTIHNSLFYGNELGTNDYIINVGSNTQIYNSIFENNRIGKSTFNYLNKVNYSAFPEANSSSNLFLDPKFIDPENGDFRLSCESPLINAGFNAYAPSGTDLDGNIRVFAGKVDIGPYEFQGDPAVAQAVAVPDFTFSNATPCMSEEVSFSNTTPNTGYFDYAWNYGEIEGYENQIDGNYQYDTAGVYELTLVATNACGKSTSTTKNIEVIDAFIPRISHASIICPADTLDFETDAVCSNYEWTIEEGVVLSGEGTKKIKVLFGDGTNGNGKVNLLATGCDGNSSCELPVSIEIPIVQNVPKIVYDTVSCQAGDGVYVLENRDKVPGVIYTWTAINGSIVGESSSYGLDSIFVNWVSGQTVGQLKVETSHELLTCGGGDSVEVKLKPTFSINQVNSICANSDITYSVNQSGLFEWWVEGDENEVTDVNAGSILWGDVAGTYQLNLKTLEPANFCNANDSVFVTLVKVEDIDSILGEILVDSVTNYRYEINAPNTQLNYDWIVEGGTITSDYNNRINVVWNDGETKQLKAVSALNSGSLTCYSDTSVLPIRLDYFFDIISSSSVCFGDDLNISLNNDTIDFSSIVWSVDDEVVASDVTSFTHTFNKQGRRYIDLEITVLGKTYKASKVIDVDAQSSGIEIDGDDVLPPGGNVVRSYTISNEANLDLSFEVIGGSDFTFLNDTLTVAWGTQAENEIIINASKIGEACSRLPYSYEVKHAPEFSPALSLVSSAKCLNGTSVYSFNADEFVSDINWGVEGGVVLEQNAKEATIEWYNEAGSFDVRVVYQRFGEQQFFETVVLQELPTPEINDLVLCGENGSSLSTSQSYASYSWSKEDDGLEFSTSSLPSITKSGYYRVEVTDANGCKGNASKDIRYIPIPKAKINVTQNTTFCEADSSSTVFMTTFNGANYKYQWYKDNTAIAGATAQSYTYPVNHSIVGSSTFRVKASSDVCSFTSSPLSVRVKSTAECTSSNNNNNEPGDTTTTVETCDDAVSFKLSGCQPFEITDIVSSKSDFKWTFGDNTSSTSSNPLSHTYNDLGSYRIKVVSGCDSHSEYATVPALAVFTLPEVACKGQAVLFKDYSVNLFGNSITGWKWDFGDGTDEEGNTVVEDRSTSHAYASAGTYDISFTVDTDGDFGMCSHTFSQTLVVNEIPTVDFSVINPACDESLYTFANESDESKGKLDYLWTFENSIKSINKDASFDYSTYGQKSISLKATDFTTCSNTITKDITVVAPVQPESISYSGKLDICDGSKIDLVAPSGEQAYKWYNGSSALPTTTQTLAATEPGTYWAKYIRSGCETITDSVVVKVFRPSAYISYNDSLCEGNNVTLQLNGGTVYLLDWLKNDVSISNNRRTFSISELQASDVASYVVEMTQTSTGCTYQTEPLDLSVYSNPTKPDLSTDDSLLCVGDTLYASYTTSNINSKSKWYDNNQLIATNTNSTFSFLPNRDVRLKIVIEDTIHGCSTTSDQIEATVGTDVQLNFGKGEELCAGKGFDLKTNLSTNDYTFEWWREDSLLTETKGELLLTQLALSDSGAYFVRAVSKGTNNVIGCEFYSDTFQLDVISGPNKPTIFGEDGYCEGEISKIWTELDNNFVWNTGQSDTLIKVYQPGIYSLAVTDTTTGCVSRSIKEVKQYPLPDFYFLSTGYYEWCASDPLELDGLNDFSRYQWKLNGTAYGKENAELYPRKTGNYTLELESDEGCIAESDSLRITSKPCACIVVNASDSLNTGSLRDAILCANSKPGVDFIHFAIEGDGPFVIDLDSLLPVIEEGAVIDAFSQSGEGVYDVTLTSSSNVELGLVFDYAAATSEVKGFTITGFDEGVLFRSNGEDNVIEANRFVDNKIAVKIDAYGVNNWVTSNSISGIIGVYSRQNENLKIEDNDFIDLEIANDLSNVSSSWIVGNSYSGVLDVAIQLNGTTNGDQIEKNNFYDLMGDAIRLADSASYVAIESNSFGLDENKDAWTISGNAIGLLNTSNISINSNEFVGNTDVVIQVERSDSTTIDENTFGITKGGVIHVNNTDAIVADSNITVTDNQFVNVAGNAVQSGSNTWVTSNSFSGSLASAVVVENNSRVDSNVFVNSGNHDLEIGSDGWVIANSFTGSVASSLVAESDVHIEDNDFVDAGDLAIEAVSNNWIVSNSFTGSVNGAIDLNSGNRIEKNDFVNSGGNDISVTADSWIVSNSFSGSLANSIKVEDQNVSILNNTFQNSNSGVDAIELITGANGDKEYATFDDPIASQESIVLMGTTEYVGDSVQVFTSIKQDQQAIKYVGTAVSDASKQWTISVTSSSSLYNPDARNYYVNTATHLGNTSELSPYYESGCYNCVCTVRDNSDAGESTLRAAIDSVHNGVCRIVNFELSDPKIELETPLRSIDKSIVIDASPNNVWIVGSSSSGRLFEVNSDQSQFFNLKIEGTDTAFVVNGDFAKVSTVEVLDVDFGAVVSGDNNQFDDICLNCGAENNSSIASTNGFVITGSNSGVVNSRIVNTVESAIQVDGGIENTFFNNEIVNTSKSIEHLNGGNDNYAYPSNLIAEYATDQTATLSGTSTVGDIIEVYLSSFTGKPATERVIQFEVTEENWTISIPTEYTSPTENVFFIVSATNENGSTSEFSPAIKLGDGTVYCIVDNTDDQGEGSLRDAVDCANQAAIGNGSKALIVFDLPENDREIVVFNKGFEITNSYGVTIDPQGEEIDVTSQSPSLEKAFTLAADNVVFNDITIEGFKTAVRSASQNNQTFEKVKFIQNDTAISIEGGTSHAINLSSVISGKVGASISKAGILITNNDFGTDSTVVERSLYMTESNSAIVTGNDVRRDTNIVSNFYDFEFENLSNAKISSNNFYYSKAFTSRLHLLNIQKSTVDYNTFKGGIVGMSIKNSKRNRILNNKFDAVTVKGVDVQNSDFINFSKNLARDIDSAVVIIDLHLDQAEESNIGQEAPYFTSATYKHRQLILIGRSEADSEVEVFETDTNGVDVIAYLGTVFTDRDGFFEYKMSVAPENINDKTFKATSTFSKAFLSSEDVSYPHTSQYSEAFNPNLKICFVTSNSDENIKGSLRYNIHLANEDKCHLMLFDIKLGSTAISLTSDLPDINLGKLTIDGTYQFNGRPSVVDEGQKNAFVVDVDSGGVYIHGLRTTGFDYPYSLANYSFVGITEAIIEDYDSSAVQFKCDTAEFTLIDSSIVSSELADVLLTLNKPRIIVSSSDFRGGKKNALVINSDSTSVQENSFESIDNDSIYAILIHDVDSAYVSGNRVGTFRYGIQALRSNNVNVFSNRIEDTTLFSLEEKNYEEDKFWRFKRAITIDSLTNSIFFGNEVSLVDTAFVITNSPKIDFSGNVVKDTCFSLGILLANSDSARVDGNTFPVFNMGIRVDSSSYVNMAYNTIYWHDSVGVFIDSLSSHTTLKKNTVGSRNYFDDVNFSTGIGLYILSSDNLIGGDENGGNIILSNLKGGIHIVGKSNKITFNEIFRNDTTIERPTQFAIQHIDNGNLLKGKPQVLDYETLGQGQYLVSGRALPNDSIHLYRSEGYYQDARYFAGKGLTGTDSTWSIIVDTSIFDEKIVNTTLTILATATDLDSNTSELSDMFYVGNCFVNTNLDNIDNEYPIPQSFRQGVACVNSQDQSTGLYFSIDGSTGYDLLLKREMISLNNKYGIEFSAANLATDSLSLTTMPLWDSTMTDIHTFWKISENTGSSTFRDLKVARYDSAMVINDSNRIAIVNFGFRAIAKAVLLANNGFEYLRLDSIKTDSCENTILLDVGSKGDTLLLANSELKLLKKAFELDSVDYVTIYNNSATLFNAEVFDIRVSDSVFIYQNQFEEIETSTSVQITTANYVSFHDNQFAYTDAAPSVVLNSLAYMDVVHNTFKDSCSTAFRVNNSRLGRIDSNQVALSINAAFEINNSDSLYIRDNEIEEIRTLGFLLNESDSILLSRNLILDTEYGKLIELNYGGITSSNHDKPQPVIDRYIVQLESPDYACDEDTNRLGIYLYGYAEPLDVIEIFFTDTVKTTFEEYVDTTRADSSGIWVYLIDRELYSRDLTYIYSFIATASDSLLRTSEASIPFRFDSVRNDLYVKNTNNGGVNSLRSAINQMNCSDLHNRVFFEIEGETAPYVIAIEDSLPAISAVLGFTMDVMGTQSEFQLREDIEGDSTVIVDGSALLDTATLFTILSESEWGEISNMKVANAQKAFKLLNQENQFSEVSIAYTLNSERGSVAIVDSGNGSNNFEHLYVAGYDTALYLTASSRKNNFEYSTFELSNQAIVIDSSVQNTFSYNDFNTDSIAVSIQNVHEFNNFIENSFGADDKPLKYPAIQLHDADYQFIYKNHFPYGASELADTTLSMVFIGDSSDANQIIRNRFGIGIDGYSAATTNMYAIHLQPSVDTHYVASNVIVENDFSGFSVPVIYMNGARGGNVTSNYIGVDSNYVQREGDESYAYVRGNDTTALLIQNSNFVEVAGNHIVNFSAYGVDVYNSDNINIVKNKIFSEKSVLKAIQLNHSSDSASNPTVFAPSIDTNKVYQIDELTIEGSSQHPNALLHLYEGFSYNGNQPSHALRYVKSVVTKADGSWEAVLPTENFGFSKYNKYIAQIQDGLGSSELSDLYIVQSLLCRLIDNNVNLIEDYYDPCPESNFTIDAQLEGLTYKWYPANQEFDTITSQVALIAESADMTLEISDDFGCTHTETFEVDYKPRPLEPNFIVSSQNYVSDTLVLIDVSGNEYQSYDWSSTDGLSIASYGEVENTLEGPDGKLYPTGYEVRFIAPDTGTYTITQRSMLNDCFVSMDKEISVSYKDPDVKDPYSLNPGKTTFEVSPSPIQKDSEVTLNITSTSEDEIFVEIRDVNGSVVGDRASFSGAKSYEVTMSTFGLQSGAYIFKLTTPSSVLVYKIIVE